MAVDCVVADCSCGGLHCYVSAVDCFEVALWNFALR